MPKLAVLFLGRLAHADPLNRRAVGYERFETRPTWVPSLDASVPVAAILNRVTTAAAVAHAETNPSIIGDGWGLDHFMIALADPVLVKSTYAEKLGFTVLRGAKRPGGHENATIVLAPAYIELIFLYDRRKAEASDDRITKRNLSKIDQGGGAIAYNVEV